MNHTITSTGTSPPRTGVRPTVSGRAARWIARRAGADTPGPENRTITPPGTQIGPRPGDTNPVVYVVAIHDSDGCTFWYQITKDWYDWAARPYDGTCPADLTAAHIAAGSDAAVSEFAHHTRQHLAVEANAIGATLADVIRTSPTGAVIFEVAGTSY